MNKVFEKVSLVLVVSGLLFVSGCVSRTVLVEPENRGAKINNAKTFGSDPQAKIVEKKLIWFWQPEFWQSPDK